MEHSLDLRPLQTKRTAKRDIPTEECVAAVEAVLSSTGGGDQEATRSVLLRLIPTPVAERKKQTHDPELKKILDEMRRRLSAGHDHGGKDAA